MKTLEAEFEIVTPMFLGGGDQQATRIRESSIKGALAFWWRAKKFASLFTTANPGEPEITAALAELQERERRIFGSTKGRGIFDLRVVQGPTKDTHGGNFPRTSAAGARYLGYGLYERTCLIPRASFVVLVHFQPKCNDSEIREIESAIMLFGLLGGLGSRVRRGWGSVALRSTVERNREEIPRSCETADKYKDALARVLGVKPKCSGSKFPLSAFSAKTRIQLWDGAAFGDGLSALKAVGDGLLRYRARGNPKHSVGSLNVEASFEWDHDWFRQDGRFHPTKGGRGTYVPQRTAFGLPHNYDKVFGVGAPEPNDRRASPLLFHIHKVGSTYMPVALFVPTKFLPDTTVAGVNTERVYIGNPAAGNRQPTNQYRFDQQIITDYLDGVHHVDGGRGENARDKYFPGKDIWP